MSKLFVRERGNVGEGDGVPRFEIVAVSGADLQVYHSHVRRAEVEALAAEIGASIVYLPRGQGGNGQGAARQRRAAGSKSRAKKPASKTARPRPRS
jgi:hypothetical protein